jgi:cytochrome b561
MSHSMRIKMRDEVKDDRWTRRLAFPASLVLHLLIAAFPIFGLLESLPKPQNNEAD